MAGINDHPEWDEEELVPLGQIRPSREHFGPLPAAKARPSKSQGSQKQQSRSRDAARNPNARSSAQASVPARRPSAERNDEVEIDLRDAAPARSGRSSQQASARRAQPPRRDAAAGRRGGRDEQFVNRLAAADRAPRALKPTSGWRGALLKVTGGIVNVGPSAEERREIGMRHQARRPVVDGTVAVFSRKGGVGKTTISAYLGLTLAEERGGRIVAIDGDAEAGSLGWLLAPNAPSTLAALASADPIPTDYAGLRRFTTLTPSGLEVVVGDPAEMGPISTTGLEAVADQLGRHYDVSIFDTGAGVTRATGRVLVGTARVLLLVMGPSVDSVRAAERTLAWLDERPGEAAHADVKVIAVINGIPANAKGSHVQKIESHFANRCDAVVRIPWDAHLAAGSSSVSLDRLAKPTRQAFLELAATMVGALARPARRPEMAGAR